MELAIIKETPSLTVHTDMHVHSMHTFTSSHIHTQAQTHTHSAPVLYMRSYSEKIVATSLG